MLSAPEVADDGVAQSLGPSEVLPDVVSCPPGAEGVAAGGELPDQVGEDLVEGAARGLGAQQRDDVVDRGAESGPRGSSSRKRAALPPTGESNSGAYSARPSWLAAR